MDIKDPKLILTNPLYCLGQLHQDCAKPHGLLVSEEGFIKTGTNLISLKGPTCYIRSFLGHLKEPSNEGDTNPLTCIGSVHPECVAPREPFLPEDVFIFTGKNFIERHGAAKYIRYLLQHLKNPNNYGYKEIFVETDEAE